ncbi:hypothetical protein PGT21_017925 [Puccinia graminis f. sp. tritici]|uniref:Secreted protein n=1 Tax=Puccinia graminis f. sp. tritici TaxID=56615 RepID=A0A5B0MKI7_PUCGR|nr:hypothetical protein PGT21_017925 [Puccinia graminis f. sp. tritici]KAA1126928.1 hypothetical protein PGTUg99_032156 [Puccinia graminis f. sp. tritici]
MKLSTNTCNALLTLIIWVTCCTAADIKCVHCGLKKAHECTINNESLVEAPCGKPVLGEICQRNRLKKHLQCRICKMFSRANIQRSVHNDADCSHDWKEKLFEIPSSDGGNIAVYRTYL